MCVTCKTKFCQEISTEYCQDHEMPVCGKCKADQHYQCKVEQIRSSQQLEYQVQSLERLIGVTQGHFEQFYIEGRWPNFKEAITEVETRFFELEQKVKKAIDEKNFLDFEDCETELAKLRADINQNSVIIEVMSDSYQQLIVKQILKDPSNFSLSERNFIGGDTKDENIAQGLTNEKKHQESNQMQAVSSNSKCNIFTIKSPFECYKSKHTNSERRNEHSQNPSTTTNPFSTTSPKTNKLPNPFYKSRYPPPNSEQKDEEEDKSGVGEVEEKLAGKNEGIVGGSKEKEICSEVGRNVEGMILENTLVRSDVSEKVGDGGSTEKRREDEVQESDGERKEKPNCSLSMNITKSDKIEFMKEHIERKYKFLEISSFNLNIDCNQKELLKDFISNCMNKGSYDSFSLNKVCSLSYLNFSDFQSCFEELMKNPPRTLDLNYFILTEKDFKYLANAIKTQSIEVKLSCCKYSSPFTSNPVIIPSSFKEKYHISFIYNTFF
ncbi:unnamed protein product [Moneuplotes crassus]|uniref:Uncharacterized protein n=1 Tax=Euplotes crassus TaxID=5936 RepID=A0AAD1XE70_EUPCR|nr:unnamed protein product [Moneuplotes crassus]